ncbi:hypothetical protein SRABI106_03273 [Rahnella aquatilis]|nr:hypothetical protein SRABI106_03273 [Rahnella aquatilis]
MHMPVIANPQVNSLLAPTGNTVEFVLQVENQFVDKAQIEFDHRGILNTHKMRLQQVTGRLERILQFTQRAGSF